MQEIELVLTGTNPVLFHNSRLVNPFDPINKEKKRLTDKRTKQTEEDRIMVARLEWTAGWYWDDKDGPIMPLANVYASILKAAKSTRNGPLVDKGVNMLSLQEPIDYQGPRDLESLWGSGLEGSPFVDYRPVGQQAVKIMRCRPILHDWTVTTTWVVDETIIDPEQFIEFATFAGKYIGVGDYRAMYGRFAIKAN